MTGCSRMRKGQKLNGYKKKFIEGLLKKESWERSFVYGQAG